MAKITRTPDEDTTATLEREELADGLVTFTVDCRHATTRVTVLGSAASDDLIADILVLKHRTTCGCAEGLRLGGAA